MKIRSGFVSNSSSSSFVAYHFIGLPKGEDIEQLYDENLPEKELTLREHVDWGLPVRDITASLDKNSAIAEVRDLINSHAENTDSEKLRQRIIKGVNALIKQQTGRYNEMWGRRDIEILTPEKQAEIQAMYPLLNKSQEEALQLFEENFEGMQVIFVKESYDVSDNNFCGRRYKLMEVDDGDYAINGKEAPIKALFPNCEILTVVWCVWSDQNNIDDEFWDELDHPDRDQVRTMYGICDEKLLRIAGEVMSYPHADDLIYIVSRVEEFVDDIMEDQECTDEVARKTLELLQALVNMGERVDADTVIERLGVNTDEI